MLAKANQDHAFIRFVSIDNSNIAPFGFPPEPSVTSLAKSEARTIMFSMPRIDHYVPYTIKSIDTGTINVYIRDWELHDDFLIVTLKNRTSSVADFVFTAEIVYMKSSSQLGSYIVSN